MKINVRVNETNMGDMDGMDIDVSMNKYASMVEKTLGEYRPYDDINVQFGTVDNGKGYRWWHDAACLDAEDELTMADEIEEDVDNACRNVFNSFDWVVEED